MNIYQKLLDFQGRVSVIRKTETNPHFGKKYADINTILAAVSDPLRECGLSFVQQSQADGMQTIVFNAEKPEESVSSFVPYLLPKHDMQGLGSAMTYARRYGLVSLLMLEQEDDDGNAACAPPAKSAQKPSALKPQSIGSGAGSRKMPFGNNKGKTFDQVGAEEVSKLRQWCAEKDPEKFADLIADCDDFLSAGQPEIFIDQTADDGLPF